MKLLKLASLKPVVLGLGTLCGIHGFFTLAVDAQVVPDLTLPDRSQVEQIDDAFVITAGTRVQSNLFHSFEEFSVPTAQRASFQNLDPSIERILARVTGRSESFIDGVVEALQQNGEVSTADLFLINPNGIVFGPNASLNVGGSFVASTADRILFEEGAEFRADGTQTALLTVNVPLGLQFGSTVAEIEHFSDIGVELDEDNDFPIAGGLEVLPEQTLALVGGDVAVVDGLAIAPNGRIALGSVGSGSVVTLTPDSLGWAFNYDQVQQFQSLTLDFAGLEVSGEQGGEIGLVGDTVLLDSGSRVQAITRGRGRGGGVSIRSNTILFDDDSQIQTSTIGPGRAGDIRVQGERVQIDGLSAILSKTLSDGRGGAVTLLADHIVLRNGGQLGTEAFGAGRSGHVTVVGNESIELSGGVRAFIDGNEEWFPSSFFARAQEGAIGAGGNITITTDRLSLLGGAQIVTPTSGSSQSGLLQVNASTVDIVGTALRPNGSLLIGANELPFPSGLYANAQPGSTGDGNDVVVTVDRLSVRDGGVIRTGTFGSGQSGDLIIRDADVVEVIGTDINDFAPSTLFAASGGIPGITPFQQGEATGAGGTVEIDTDVLRVLDGGAIAVGALENSAMAGNLTIRARVIELDQGNLVAETTATDGGNITLEAMELLTLRNNSLISATAGLAERGGNGGVITIDADFITAGLTENSDIRANAFEGNGGQIIIRSRGIIGIEPQDELTPNSDITTRSERGIDGVIQITTTDDALDRPQFELPSDLVDASRLVAQGCGTSERIAQHRQGEFFNIGRGGITPLATHRVVDTNSTAVDDLQLPSVWNATHSNHSENPYVEAQGAVIDAQGDVQLVAELPSSNIQVRCQW